MKAKPGFEAERLVQVQSIRANLTQFMEKFKNDPVYYVHSHESIHVVVSRSKSIDVINILYIIFDYTDTDKYSLSRVY